MRVLTKNISTDEVAGGCVAAVEFCIDREQWAGGEPDRKNDEDPNYRGAGNH
jgi:hypothetical protein